jgi:zinc protease
MDPPGKEGLSDFTAEMMTLGTKNRDSQRLALEMENLGARYSAGSDWNASFLEVLGLSEDFPTLMDLLGDILLRPAFPREEVTETQQRRISQLIQQREQSEVIANEIIVQQLLTGTPYSHPTYGTLHSLQSLEDGDPKSFYQNNYSPRNTVLFVVGDLTPEEIWKQAEGLLGGWIAEKGTEGQHTSPTRPKGRKIIVVNRPDLTQSQIRLGLLGIKRNDEDYVPFKVMNYIFGGGGFSSRLMQRIRSEKGYTYGITSSFKAGSIEGPFVISTFTPTANTLPVIEEILSVMQKFIKEGVNDQEIEEAKNYFIGGFPLTLETIGQMSKQILELELYGIDFDYLSSYREAIKGVTIEEINNLASTFLLPEDLIIVVVGRAEDFLEPLRNLGEVELIQYSEVAGLGCSSSVLNKHLLLGDHTDSPFPG